MSRIDDALRRALGHDAAIPSAVADPDPEQFPSEAPTAPPTRVPLDGAGREALLPAEPVRLGATQPDGSGPGIQRFASKWQERLARGEGADPTLIEQFRRLAATLHHAQLANGLRSVMVTSAAPGDGKTLTAVNLAVVLADSYHANVLLVDADLRRPSIPSVIDLSNRSGLSEALRADADQKLVLVPITSRLTLLPAGEPIANSIEALTSPRMGQILDEAAARFDWVILDGPPVGATADAKLLTEMVGGTLFVIHAGQTQCPDVQKAVDALGREQIIGVVLNGVRNLETPAYYYGVPRD